MRFEEVCSLLESPQNTYTHFVSENSFLKILQSGYIRGSQYDVTIPSKDSGKSFKENPIELCVIRNDSSLSKNSIEDLSDNAGTGSIRVYLKPTIFSGKLRNVKKPYPIAEYPLQGKLFIENDLSQFFCYIVIWLAKELKKVKTLADFSKEIDQNNIPVASFKVLAQKFKNSCPNNVFVKAAKKYEEEARKIIFRKPSSKPEQVWLELNGLSQKPLFPYQNDSVKQALNDLKRNLFGSFNKKMIENTKNGLKATPMQIATSKNDTYIVYHNSFANRETEERIDLSKNTIPVKSEYMQVYITGKIESSKLRQKILEYSKNDPNLFIQKNGKLNNYSTIKNDALQNVIK